MNLLKRIQEQFVIPVIRQTDIQALESICLALASGGFTILEITLMNEAAFSIIKKLSAQHNLIVGAGTVLTVDQAEKAIDSGARFLVSPGLNRDTLAIARKLNIPFFPGVLTPTEVMQAKNSDCHLLKVFPISVLGGVDYIKLLQGPFPELQWMPSGGISLKEIKSYMRVGVTCVGIGGELTSAEIIKEKNWQALSKLAAQYLHEVRSCKI